jgi:glycosyltransferase involved in cell wall biosynthesis
LKILLIFYEPRISGQTTHVLSIARFLDKDRYQLTVVIPSHLQQCEPAFLQTGVKVVLLPMRKLFWPFSSISALIRLIRLGKMDVVHIHSQETGLTARPLSWIAGARNIFYTPQTIDIRQIRWNWLYILLERVLARITKVIISVNEADRDRLSRWGIPSQKLTVIRNGIDVDATNLKYDRHQICSTLGIEIDQPLVMQVGRLSEQKNPLDFVEGARLVLRELPDVQFVLVGEGPLEREVLAQIRSLRLENKIHLVGWQPEAFHLMSGADLVTLTSLWEGTPYSLLEAMASCKPVVTTSVNGCKEIVVDGVTGFLVPQRDPVAWANRVITLLTNPALAEDFGQQGRKRVQAMFSIQKMIGQLEILYSQMADIRPSN